MKEWLKDCLKKVMYRYKFRFYIPGGFPRGVSLEIDLIRLFQAKAGGAQFILDVGANLGQTARRFKVIFPKAPIHCFEPSSSNYTKLVTNTRRWEGVICHNTALGAHQGKAAMVLFLEPGQEGRNRIITGADADAKGDAREDVHVETLDGICAQFGIESIDILKLDVEGYEVEVLKGGTDHLASGKIRCILAEVDFFRKRTHADFFEMNDLLTGYGYQILGFYDWSGGSWIRKSDFTNCVWVHDGFSRELEAGQA